MDSLTHSACLAGMDQLLLGGQVDIVGPELDTVEPAGRDLDLTPSAAGIEAPGPGDAAGEFTKTLPPSAARSARYFKAISSASLVLSLGLYSSIQITRSATSK